MKIEVVDTGIGISEENQSKLFKFFGMIQDSAARNVNGIGLGLVITKTLVE